MLDVFEFLGGIMYSLEYVSVNVFRVGPTMSYLNGSMVGWTEG